MKRNVYVLSTALALLFLSTPQALGHASLTGANPAGRTQIEKMPSEIWVEFDENLETLGDTPINFLTVKDSQDQRLDDGIAQVAGARLYTQIIKDAVPGKIIVSFRVVSADGHPVEGVISYTLLASTTGQSPAPNISQRAKVTPETKVSASSTPTTSEAIISKDVDESTGLKKESDFFHRHRLHFIEFGVGTLLIGTWWIYERRKKNSPH